MSRVSQRAYGVERAAAVRLAASLSKTAASPKHFEIARQRSAYVCLFPLG